MSSELTALGFLRGLVERGRPEAPKLLWMLTQECGARMGGVVRGIGIRIAMFFIVVIAISCGKDNVPSLNGNWLQTKDADGNAVDAANATLLQLTPDGHVTTFVVSLNGNLCGLPQNYRRIKNMLYIDPVVDSSGHQCVSSQANILQLDTQTLSLSGSGFSNGLTAAYTRVNDQAANNIKTQGATAQ